MSRYSIARHLTVGLVASTLGWATPAVGHADPLVLPGWDLFETVTPGTSFRGLQLRGVPLISFDFGPGIGVRDTGTADTIVRRLDPVSAPGGETDLEMVALQLMSVDPVDLSMFGGVGTDFIFITLQSIRGGPPSTGTMTINFNPTEPAGPPPDQPIHGTASSVIDVFFDVRPGNLMATPLLSMNHEISGTFPWSHFPPAFIPPDVALEIPGVNVFLNGQTRSNDFWPVGQVGETHVDLTGIHLVQAACRARPGGVVAAQQGPECTLVPEPATLLLLGSGLVALARKGLGVQR